MNELKNKVIKICEPTFPTGKAPIKLKDEEKNKYNLWKTTQQGESMAYAFFKTLESGGAGQMVEIGYVEELKSFVNDKGKEINFTERTIRTMKASNENMGAEQVIDQHRATKPLKGQSLPSNPPTRIEQSQENTYNQEKPKDEVQNHIRWCNSLNNTSLIIAHSDMTLEKAKSVFEDLANFIYKLEPKEEVTGNESFNQPLGNNGEIPDGQREDTAELQRKEPVIDLDASYNQPLH